MVEHFKHNHAQRIRIWKIIWAFWPFAFRQKIRHGRYSRPCRIIPGIVPPSLHRPWGRCFAVCGFMTLFRIRSQAFAASMPATRAALLPSRNFILRSPSSILMASTILSTETEFSSAPIMVPRMATFAPFGFLTSSAI